MCDRGRLIVNEPVTNSLKYAFPDDRTCSILVRIRRMADGVELEVEDDGVGVRPDAAPHGIGLGRKLVQRLVSQNHGSITVASESGVRVTVKLPLDCLGRT